MDEFSFRYFRDPFFRHSYTCATAKSAICSVNGGRTNAAEADCLASDMRESIVKQAKGTPYALVSAKRLKIPPNLNRKRRMMIRTKCQAVVTWTGSRGALGGPGAAAVRHVA
jgi:hypothetical protein